MDYGVKLVIDKPADSSTDLICQRFHRGSRDAGELPLAVQIQVHSSDVGVDLRMPTKSTRDQVALDMVRKSYFYGFDFVRSCVHRHSATI